MRAKGKLVSWDADKGFGFIAPATDDKNVFVHASNFSNRKRKPQINDVITYTMSRDERGRDRAIDATFSGETLARKKVNNTNRFGLYFAALFIIVLVLLYLLSVIPKEVVYLYLGLSTLTVFAYVWDKRKARSGHWRTPESTLHFLALAGGWPGAAVAQHVFRHKSKKRAFRLVFWGTVILNVLALIWLNSQF